MGIYYHLYNSKTNEYTHKLGKIGEFCIPSICFQLGWNKDDVRCIPDTGSYPNGEQEEPLIEPTLVMIPNTPLVFGRAHNITRNQLYVHPLLVYLTSDLQDVIIEKCSWNKYDDIEFSDITGSSHIRTNIMESYL